MSSCRSSLSFGASSAESSRKRVCSSKLRESNTLSWSITVSRPSTGLPSARARSVICMSMPSCGSKPVLVSANCVSTSAAAQGSSFAITISGTSSDAASFVHARVRARRRRRPRATGSRAACRCAVMNLHRFERIHVVEIDFEHDDVGRLARRARAVRETAALSFGSACTEPARYTVLRAPFMDQTEVSPRACALPARRTRATATPARPRARPRRIASGKIMPRILRQSGSARQCRWRRWSGG